MSYPVWWIQGAEQTLAIGTQALHQIQKCEGSGYMNDPSLPLTTTAQNSGLRSLRRVEKRENLGQVYRRQTNLRGQVPGTRGAIQGTDHVHSHPNVNVRTERIAINSQDPKGKSPDKSLMPNSPLKRSAARCHRLGHQSNASKARHESASKAMPTEVDLLADESPARGFTDIKVPNLEGPHPYLSHSWTNTSKDSILGHQQIVDPHCTSWAQSKALHLRQRNFSIVSGTPGDGAIEESRTSRSPYSTQDLSAIADSSTEGLRPNLIYPSLIQHPIDPIYPFLRQDRDDHDVEGFAAKYKELEARNEENRKQTLDSHLDKILGRSLPEGPTRVYDVQRTLQVVRQEYVHPVEIEVDDARKWRRVVQRMKNSLQKPIKKLKKFRI